MRTALPHFGRVLLLVLGAGALGPAIALPDLERGIQALKNGDLDAAERDLRPLAERGYREAQIQLARLYTQRGSETALEEAIRWYWTVLPYDESVRTSLAKAMIAYGGSDEKADALLREADEDGDPDALKLRLRLYRDRPDLVDVEEAAWLAFRAASTRSAELVSEAVSWYREHSANPEFAEAGASLCAKWVARIPECHADLVQQYRAVGDAEALEQAVEQTIARYEDGEIGGDLVERTAHRLMSASLPGEPAPAEAYRLYALVADASPAAKTRMARLLMEDPMLDRGRDARRLLEEAHEAGDPDAAYYLARIYLDPQLPQADPEHARALLEEVVERRPAAHFYLGRLYLRGYLGRSDPERALEHFLLAARSGYSQADLSLARMYAGKKGVRFDPVNAYCFARLAAHNGVPGGKELLTKLHSELGPEVALAGQRKAEAEFFAREAARSEGTPDAPASAESQLAEHVP
ncbi:MAG: hypothetical protein AB1651_07590 [Pseudomonadota bacterium]